MPMEMAGARPGGSATLPLPGADSRAVLTGLGFDEDRIAALIAAGTVGESG